MKTTLTEQQEKFLNEIKDGDIIQRVTGFGKLLTEIAEVSGFTREQSDEQGIYFNPGLDTLAKETPMVFTFKVNDCISSTTTECGTTCHEATAYTKQDLLYHILRTIGAGFIEINKYGNGTHIIFYLKKNHYDINDNIEVRTPGVNRITLTKGKEYFVAEMKYNSANSIEERKEQFSRKRKLVDIKVNNSNNQYDFYFEGLEEPISAFTRGNVRENTVTMHRIDHVIISDSYPWMKKYIVDYCSQEYLSPMDEDAMSFIKNSLLAIFA